MLDLLLSCLSLTLGMEHPERGELSRGSSCVCTWDTSSHGGSYFVRMFCALLAAHVSHVLQCMSALSTVIISTNRSTTPCMA